jgi:hypothetical protein
MDLDAPKVEGRANGERLIKLSGGGNEGIRHSARQRDIL